MGARDPDWFGHEAQMGMKPWWFVEKWLRTIASTYSRAIWDRGIARWWMGRWNGDGSTESGYLCFYEVKM